ncbi:hypothetical protein GIB67_008966 [Kingdonia uniflora]|uniref:RBR-type E3 ubiquitin transferase n=1 Tax=Kingdonia uniflora TaxID=39325 RepID=A0A7J7LVX3_9MAGN|nr:hypothetical protein GIB67_008966 [Kingdonia uniflora]
MGDIDDVDLITEIVDLENDSHFFTPISCRGSSTKNAISVEHYVKHRDLHQAIMASILQTTRPIIDLSEDDDDEVQEIKPFKAFRKKPFKFPSVTEQGQSSSSNSSTTPILITTTFVCEICFDPKLEDESFNIKGCTHSFCSECMVKYVASKIQENVTAIRCPESNCSGVLEPEFCRSILPREVFDRWGDALCESLILGSEKFYCPFKDCSALLLDEGGVVVRESECPYCSRLFCAQCKVPWHTGIECEGFQSLNENERGREDIMLMSLAQNQKWQRCSKCKIYVERTEGCLFMKCRFVT